MPAKKKNSLHQKALYESYRKEGRVAKNKAAKIARHKRKHPNDLQKVGVIPDYTSKKAKVYDFGRSYAKQAKQKRNGRR